MKNNTHQNTKPLFCCSQYDVVDVADTILKLAAKREVLLTPQQLVKLAYLAEGWSLVLREASLYSNRIEAWRYGPNIPDLYHLTRHHGRFKIGLKELGDLDAYRVSVQTVRFLQSLLDKYGHLDGPTLSYLTHQAGSPWSQVIASESEDNEISRKAMRSYFQRLLGSNFY